MWAIDAEIAESIGSCDPDEGDFTSLGPMPGIAALLGCGEIKFDPEGNLFASLLWRAQQGAELLNSLFTIDPETGSITWRGDLPVQSPVQAIAFDPNVPFRSALRPASAAAPLAVAPTARGDVLASAGRSELQSCTGASR